MTAPAAPGFDGGDEERRALRARVAELEAECEALRRAQLETQHHEQNLAEQNAVLVALSRSRAISVGDLGTAYRELTSAAARTLDVERVSLWFFTEDGSCISCADLYERNRDVHSQGLELSASDYPSYFEALRRDRLIAADEAQTDPRTCEFRDGYLRPLGIGSMMDAPVRRGGETIGVLCHEHVGEPRHWSLEDQAFATSLADLVAMALGANERRQALHEAKTQHAFLRQVLDINPCLLFAKDRDGVFTLVNRALAEVYGTTPEELTGRTDADFNPHPEQVSRFRADDLEVMDTLKEKFIAEEVINDARGRVRWMQTIKRPIIEEDGLANQVLGVATDITSRKRDEERQALMVAELDHRVKNTLARVLAVAEQTIASARSMEEFAETFTGRIRSMAIAHEMLARTSWEGAELSEMVARLAEPYRRERSERFVLEGTSIMLSATTAPSICMILHEMVTNASKYGALSVPDGRVTVRWKVAPDDGRECLHLYWGEAGGPPVEPPSKRGFGTELIEQMTAYQLSGRADLAFDSRGLRCDIVVPLERPGPVTPPAPERVGRPAKDGIEL